MKALFCSLCVLAFARSLLAQGTIHFGNAFGSTNNGVRALIYGPDPNDPFSSRQGNTATGLPPGTQTYGGALLAGTGYTFAICTQVGESFVEIGRTTFRTNFPGYTLAGQNIAVDPHHPSGSTVTAVVRVWDNLSGTVTNWEQAQATLAAPLGQSEPFTVGPLGGPNPDGGPDLIAPQARGVRSFNIHAPAGAFIAAQPQDLIVPPGASAQMRVDVVSVVVTTFQWQRNGADIPGATNATLLLTNVQHTDAVGYRAVVILPSATFSSRVARLIVQPNIAGIEYHFIPEWGADAFRLSYDSMPMRPVRIEVRSSLLDAWIDMGQFVNPNVRNHFFDIGPTNDMRVYRISVEP